MLALFKGAEVPKVGSQRTHDSKVRGAGSMSGKGMFGSTMLSHFRFTFGPSRCRLLELPVELRYQIIEEVLEERIEHGRCHNESFRSLPSIMFTCRQIFAEGRKMVFPPKKPLLAMASQPKRTSPPFKLPSPSSMSSGPFSQSLQLL